jgi:hypothetical protein
MVDFNFMSLPKKTRKTDEEIFNEWLEAVINQQPKDDRFELKVMQEGKQIGVVTSMKQHEDHIEIEVKSMTEELFEPSDPRSIVKEESMTEKCDMEVGPCACGVWHGEDGVEFIVKEEDEKCLEALDNVANWKLYEAFSNLLKNREQGIKARPPYQAYQLDRAFNIGMIRGYEAARTALKVLIQNDS